MGWTIGVALTFFTAIFIVLPAVAANGLGDVLGLDGFWFHVAEGALRLGIFLGYLLLIGQLKDIKRVFQYHGAEHKTIAASEHDDELTPTNVDRYSTLHVRCGTNFLLLVMVVTIFVFALFGNPGIYWRIGSRILAIPLIAGIAFELLRLGARFPDSRLIHAVMVPGLWLQKITTKPPNLDQIEVAIASFGEVLRREADEKRADA
jgi:uncharacterized protein YqhQ